MKAHLEKPNWIMRPAVSMTLAYGGVITCWFVFIACTLNLPPIFHEGPFRLIGSPAYLAFTGCNVGLTLWLALSCKAAFGAAPGLRRGQVVGIAGSLFFLAVLQFGAQALHRDLNTLDRTDPGPIAAFVEGQAEAPGQVLTCVRNALKEVYPELREALWRNSLVYENKGRFLHSLEVEPGVVRLQIYEWPGFIPSIAEGPWKLETRREAREAELVVHVPITSEDLVHLRGVVLTLPRKE